MVDLLSPSEKIVTSEAPRSAISPGEVAQPYAMLGHALDKLGEGLEAVATPLAERAGAEAGKGMVTRDAAGNIQIVPQNQFPIFGNAGVAYAHAVKVGALAEADGAAKRADIKLREDYRDDPEGYQRVADQFKQKMVQQMTAAAGPEVGNALGAAIDSTTTFTYRGLVAEKERLDLARAEGSMKAEMEAARDDAMALGRSGKGSDDENDAMRAAVSKYVSLADSRMRNPRLAYTQAMHDQDIQQFKSQIGGQVYIHDTEEFYKEHGVAAAEERAKEIQTSDKYKGLSIEERNHYYHQAVSTIRMDEAIRKQDIGLARTALSELRLTVAEGFDVPYEEGEKVAQMFDAAGDPGGAARTRATLIRLPMNHEFMRQGPAERARQINDTFDRMSVPREYVPLITKASEISGFDTGTLSRLLYQENRFRPTGISPAGAEGIAQFMPATAREYGIDPNKPEQAIPAAGRLLRDLSIKYEGNQGMAVAAYNWGQGNLDAWKKAGANPAAMPAETRAYVEKITGSPISAWMGGKAAPRAPDDTPAGTAWKISNMQLNSDKATFAEWKYVMEDYEKEKIIPSLKTIRDIRSAAEATGNAMLLEKIDHDTNRMNIAADFRSQSGPERTHAIGDIQQLAATRDLEPGHAAMLKDFIEMDAGITKGFDDNPVRTTANLYAGQPGIKMPPPLNMADENEFTAGLRARAQMVDFAARVQQRPPMSALDKNDIEAVAGALETADIPTKSRILGNLSVLPADIRNATLAKLNQKEGMMTTVAAAGIQREAPDVAMNILRGQQAVKLDPRNAPDADPTNKANYYGALDEYLPPTLFIPPDRSDPRGSFAMTRGAVYALVANQLADPANGKKEVSKDMVKDAVNQVTGGIVSSPGGTNVITPKRGMPQGVFDATLYGLRDMDLVGATTLAGEPITPRFVREQGELESYAQGQYRIKIGNRYAVTGAHDMFPGTVRPYILDLRDKQPDPKFRPLRITPDVSVPSSMFPENR